jgi:methylmalonyl-CoA mutase N-terminal domain/subunit
MADDTSPAVACARASCTLREQMDVLRDVFGVYEEPVVW